MWCEEHQMLIRVWQHDDNFIEMYPYLQKDYKMPWSSGTDLMGFLRLLKEGAIRPLTKEEAEMLLLLR